jgi:two-component system, OmpR family, phosphate regulon sensor histidine kinase PhoR
MWPALIFVLLALLVIADSLWKERRLRQQRLQARQEFTAQLLRQQQEAYTHAQAQQRALFDSMADGVALLDEHGRIQLVNDALRRLFALPPGAGQGATLLEAFRLPALADLAERLPGEKSILGFELELASTPARYLEANASAVWDRAGAYRGAIFVFHDLTRIKQLENTRKEFVANVSHELRTPLSLIKGFVETLLDGAKDDPALAARYLKTIEKHTDRLTYLIEDLLSISQLESGQVVLNFEQVPLRPLAERVLEDLRSKATEKQIQIQNDLPDGLTARADGERLEQVLFNLMENAIKYGRTGGKVAIAARTHENESVEVWVDDDGPGIPLEAQARIFERFYRVDRARARDTGGTGLGLAIVKHIVQAHGGSVWVNSQPGQGATFHFILPQVEPSAVNPTRTTSATQYPLSGRMLK